MTPRQMLLAGLLWCCAAPLPTAARAQAIQNATLRRARQAFENLEYRQALASARASLRERLTGYERARAYEILGFTYSAMDSILHAVDAFKQVILLEPERDLDPVRTSPKALSAFQVALTQVLVVRQLHVDSTAFVAGQGVVGIRFTVTQPSRIMTRVTGAGLPSGGLRIDSTAATGQINIRWPARLANGDPLPSGTYNVIVEAVIGQNNFSTSRAIRITQGAVDTLPHLAGLPGYDYLPETEVPPKSWRPMGLALVYTGIALAGTSALSQGELGSVSMREAGLIGGGLMVAGFVVTLRKPAPQPARGNILYNRLLREQLARRNGEIAQENTRRRQQVEIRVVPVRAAGAGR